MTTQPTALRLADAMSLAFPGNLGIDKAAAELRRLHAERAAADGVINDLAAKVRGLQTQRIALLEALKEIAADYADRFDLDSPSTNPGIKFTIKQASAAIKSVEENT